MQYFYFFKTVLGLGWYNNKRPGVDAHDVCFFFQITPSGLKALHIRVLDHLFQIWIICHITSPIYEKHGKHSHQKSVKNEIWSLN